MTWMRDRKEPYNLGDEEFHLAFKTDEYDAFIRNMKRWDAFATKILLWESILINDPDGYWIEIVPVR